MTIEWQTSKAGIRFAEADGWTVSVLLDGRVASAVGPSGECIDVDRMKGTTRFWGDCLDRREELVIPLWVLIACAEEVSRDGVEREC